MRLKSILYAFILLFVLVSVISITLKKLVIAPSSQEAGRSAATPTALLAMAANEVVQPQAQAASTSQPQAQATSVPTEPSPTATPLSEAASVSGVEGLRLELSQPLMFDVEAARGLAAADGSIYVASVNDAERLGMLIQAKQTTNEIVQTRAIQQNDRYRLGGMAMGAEGLWVPLAGDGADTGSTILLIDPQYLDILRSFEVADRIRAVAETDAGQVVGVNEAGDRFYAWDAQGGELRQVPNLTSTVYQDVAMVRGSLVCAGQTEDGGGFAVLDVIEPTSLTRVARHRCYARSSSGEAWITVGGFDYSEGEFLFLPEGGPRPKLLTYVLDGTTLEYYVPSATQ